MFLTDITSFMNWLFTNVLTIAGRGFSILSSFEMFGTNLLVLMLTFGVLSVLLSIVYPSFEKWSQYDPKYEKWAKDHGKE